MLTDLNAIKISSETEINDLKKARALLKAVISSNPKNSDGWIAAARVEELDGKI
jgi:pre-mRNA-processing factor 6